MLTVLEVNISGSSLGSSRFRFSNISWKRHSVARTVSPDRLDPVSLLPCTVSTPSASEQLPIRCFCFNTGMLYIHGMIYQQMQEA